MNKVIKGIAIGLAVIIAGAGVAELIGSAVTGSWNPVEWVAPTDKETGGKDGANGKDGADGKDGETPYIGENGNWFIGEINTGVKATGTDGQDGVDGENGADGKDGQTPHIGENGNWFIGDVDTGVKAAGTDGKDGVDGENGADGKDGQTPYIGENGNWFIGDVDTGVKAEGTDGKDGVDGKTPYIGEDGYWYIDGNSMGVAATAVEVVNPYAIDSKTCYVPAKTPFNKSVDILIGSNPISEMSLTAINELNSSDTPLFFSQTANIAEPTEDKTMTAVTPLNMSQSAVRFTTTVPMRVIFLHYSNVAGFYIYLVDPDTNIVTGTVLTTSTPEEYTSPVYVSGCENLVAGTYMIRARNAKLLAIIFEPW